MLVRFVTGLLDLEQDSTYKISMYAKAKQIGLPASFVELRHEAIHGDLPSLVVLRRAAETSLDWLWQDYWAYLHVGNGSLDPGGISAFVNGRQKFKEDSRKILRSYMGEMIEMTKVSDPSKVSNRAAQTVETCLKLVTICNGERLAIAELIKVLIEPEMMLKTIETLV